MIFPIGDFQFYSATAVILVLALFLVSVAGYDLRNLPRHFRCNIRWITFSAALVAGAACALSLAPIPPAGSHCVETHQLWGPMEIVLSCDSHEFIMNARHPGRLSMQNSWNQSRPLQIMVAAVLTLADAPNPQNCYSPGWLPFVLINFVLLLCALMVFKRLMNPVGTSAVIATALLGIFLVFNDVVKGFFWSAHTQMWNVFMPLLSISLSLTLLERPIRSWGFMVATGGLLGIALLAYPSLAVCAVSVVAAIALGYCRDPKASITSLLGKVGVFLVVFFLPMALWISIIKWKVGNFYFAEAQSSFREFIWIADSWQAGGVTAILDKSKIFVYEFLLIFFEVTWPILVLLAIVLLVPAQRLNAVIKARSRLLEAVAITFVVCFCFFALIGFYRNRLAFNAAVPIFIVASALLVAALERIPRQRAVIILLSIGVVSVGYVTSALVGVTWPY